jgi:hypothetical protein
MEPNLIASILTGAFALGGTLGGVVTTAHLARRADRERISVEDRRRWVAEWRHAYSAYLGIARSMCDEIDYAGNFLDVEFEENREAAQKELSQRMDKIVQRWHAELQPALGEVLLIATPEVADLAARLADGLLYTTGVMMTQDRHSAFMTWSDKSRRILEALINRMRSELGLSGVVEESPWKRDDWPWLPSVPEG